MHSELPNTVLLGQEGDFGNKRVSKELWHEDIPEQGDLVALWDLEGEGWMNGEGCKPHVH